MLLVSVFFTAPLWLGAWLWLSAIYLWRYPGRAPLMRLGGASITGALLATLAAGVSASFVSLAVTAVRFWLPSRLPFVIHLLACAVYWQHLRAAAVERSRRSGGGA